MRDTYLYGPVPSRRLGLSLGVDIVPFKVCTLDCIYCQLGRSSEKTIRRKNYVPLRDVLAELKGRVAEGLEADYVTISGSGEPTLHSELGKLIDGIKTITSIPVAILTNGTLLYRKAVRADCCKADVVAPSLDAGDEETFQKINRPHSLLSLERMVDGLCAFRAEFTGKFWLEVFLVEGINTDIEQINKIRSLVERIGPDKVQLNTAVRPTAQPAGGRVEPEKLAIIAARLGDNTEVIADFSRRGQPRDAESNRENILAILKRRPCSLNDICSALGLHHNDALKRITYLQQQGAVKSEEKNGTVFFKAARLNSPKSK